MIERKLLEVNHLKTYHDAKMIHFINPKDILYVPIED
ncbi:hypothetical protein LCGC14_1960800, partial [marine sediment metagenome]